MQETPNEILEWTEMDWTTGKRNLKADAPEEIKVEALAYEKEFFRKTGRRRIDNIDID